MVNMFYLAGIPVQILCAGTLVSWVTIAGAKIQYFERASKKFPLFIANTYLMRFIPMSSDEFNGFFIFPSYH